MRLLAHIRLLPVLIAVATLSFTIHAGEFIYGLKNMGAAMAQEAVEGHEPPPMPMDTGHGKDSAAGQTAEDVSDNEMMPPLAEPMAAGADGGQDKVEWQDAVGEDAEYSPIKAGLYEDLAKRRLELEDREAQLVTREALLSAAERELEQKIREMTTIKNEIESLLQEQSDEEKARIDSLVKIYEGMKAKEAARIFDTLDMDVLITVLSRMSERKSAPILASMNPERARTVTILLAQQKQLPSLTP